MSLLFDHAIERFDRETATLYAVGDGDLDTSEASDSPVPVQPVAEFATHHDSLSHLDREWTCLPLHGEADATGTDEFVAFTDHQVHGPVVVFERDGDHDFVPVDEFGETRLARRVRFWHSDYLPESFPPTYDAPIADHEVPTNPVDRADLFDGLGAYVDDERAATRESNRARATRLGASAVYERGGDAIPHLDCVGEDGEGVFRFRVDLPPSLERRRDGDWAFFVEGEFGVHEGNEALLHPPDSVGRGERRGFDSPVAVTVERIRGLNVWCSLDWSRVEDAAAVGSALGSGGEGFGLSVLLNPVPFDREREAVERLHEHPLGAVLAGDRAVTFGNGAAGRSEALDDDLNQEQSMAVRFALHADDVFCIHGPPGTGKTRTLVEVVRRAAAAGESVLVCADSNQAVDNLIAGSSTLESADDGSLHAHAQHGTGEFTLDRVNAERSTHDVVRARYRDTPRADVVAATNSSAGTLAREFDLLVLDEATQATCTASAIPMARAGRVVLAGDHKQLPPYSATETPPDSSYGLSLFEHLYAEGGVFEGVGLQLQTQYRMHRDIAYLPNRLFYDRTLRNGRVVEPLDGRDALEAYSVGGHVETVEHSKRNATEARLVTHLVDGLLDELPPDEVGVITPYAAQVELVERYLAARVEGGRSVTVDTVDSFQGSERTAIVLSLVRSNADGDLGFLGRPDDGPRRLNVALTRAKRYCAVVADWATVGYEADGKANAVYETVRNHVTSTRRLKSPDESMVRELVAPLDDG